LEEHYAVSERRACAVLRVQRSSHRYRSTREPQEALRKRIQELAKSRTRYGYKRLHLLLKREGIVVNKKRVHRLYCLEGLQLGRRRPRRHVSAATRQPPKQAPQAPNVAWSMDFVSDEIANGERFRVLTIVDVFTRECLAVEAGKRLTSEDVVRVLQRVSSTRGTPTRIHCDNGSEFSGRLLDLWAYSHRVVLEFSRPGKPTDNAFIESFNGSLRDECLNVHWFEDLNDAKEKLQAWQVEYNESRPHRALKNLSPREFVDQWVAQPSEVADAVDQ
jgi:putative transposase